MINGSTSGLLTFSSLYQEVISRFSGSNLPEWLSVTIFLVILFLFTLTLVLLAVYLCACLETCIITAFFGSGTVLKTKKEIFLKPLQFAVKMLIKEDSSPKNCSKILFFGVPILLFCPLLCAFCLLPSNSSFVVINQNSSAMLFLAFLLIPLAARFLAGYSSRSKYLLSCSMRVLQQGISLLIPMILCILGVSIMAGSLNINEIIQAQSTSGGLFGWFFIPQIIAAIVFFVCCLAFLNLPGLLNSLTEPNLAYKSEYSGAKFAICVFCEYLSFFLTAAFFVSLFFGGYLSPFGAYILPKDFVFLEEGFWFFSKTFLMLLIMAAVKIIGSKLSITSFLRLSYKILLPLCLINLNIAILIQYFSGVK